MELLRSVANSPEIEMARTASSSLLSGDFDRFLFEPIGRDQNGMPLSVASTLARMGLDAWQEAATLAALPADTAVEKLTALFGASSDQSLMEPNRVTLVTRLIALLPPPAGTDAPSPTISTSSSRVPYSRARMSALFFVVAYLVVLLISQFVSSRRDSPTLGGPIAESPPHAPSSR
jgi:hypothetical protein